MHPSAAVSLTDVVKVYGRAGAQVHALRGVSFRVEAGERVGLLGKSGSGKSTLLNLLGGLDRPTSGRIEVAGHDLSAMRSRDLAHYRQATVGMIFQSFNLIPTRTALQNVTLPLIFAGVHSRERGRIGQETLAAVGLDARQQHRPPELSGGEQQRVAIARALVNRPQVLLADEPTGNLDSATARDVIALLDEHVRQRGMTLLLVSHDEDLVRSCTDRVIRLQDGRLQA